MSEQPDSPRGDQISAGDVSGSKGIVVGSDNQVEIIEDNRTIVNNYFSSETEERKPFMVPPIPAKSVQRPDDITVLTKLLIEPGDANHSVCIQGMAGSGKTVLTIMLCHCIDVLEAFPDGILWATLGTDPSYLAQQQSWAEAMGYPSELLNVMDPADRANRLRALLRGKRCLVVIDDAWQTDHVNYLTLADPEVGATLISTRVGDVARRASERYEINMLPEDLSLAVLDQWSGGIAEDEHEKARELAQRLGYLPVALALAGAQIDDGWSWDDLLDAFRDQQGAELSILDFDDPQLRGESLTLTFTLSLQRLEDELEDRFIMLGAMAGAGESPFTLQGLQAVWDVERRDAKKSAIRLVKAGLLSEYGDVKDAYFLHALLTDFARACARGEVENHSINSRLYQAAIDRHTDHYLNLARESALHWQETELELSQIRCAQDRTDPDDIDQLFEWARALSVYLMRRGQLAAQMDWARRLLEAAHRAGDRRREAWAEHELGYILDKLERDQEAREHYIRSLDIRIQVGDESGEAQTRSGIGQLHAQQQEYDKALDQYQMSLTIRRSLGDQIGESIILENIGEVFENNNDFEQALSNYRESREIKQRVDYAGGFGYSYNNSGRVLMKMGRLEEAFAELEMALAFFRQVGDKPGEAATLWNIGLIHQRQKAHQEAALCLNSALNIYRMMDRPEADEVERVLADVITQLDQSE
ncbi:MAG: tetratricopeptide repeat protein [Chloroflexi bacterium]|nr:tetratricopeptide repeat protein [Chloroflexota bacterium]